MGDLMKGLRMLLDGQAAIERVCNSRDIDGDIAYELNKVYRRYKEVLEDVSAFEKNIIAQIEMETRGDSILFPGQDPDKVTEYLEQRNAFLDSKEVEFKVKSYTFKQLKPAKLSGNDIAMLEDVGLLEMEEEEDEVEKPEDDD